MESAQGQQGSSTRQGSVWPTFLLCTAGFRGATLLLVYLTGGWEKWFPLPRNVSAHGGKIDELFWICVWITGITFIQ